MNYYISDLHFHHRNIESLDKRGFNSLFDMHDYMIEKWNNKVTNNDTVYILGDFSFARGSETWDILTRLNGHLALIEGNHDFWFLDDKNFNDTVFDELLSYCEVNDGGRKVVLSHYPLPFYNHQFRRDNDNNHNTYMLYGHIHNTYDEYMLNRFINDAAKLARRNVEGELVYTPFKMVNAFCLFSDYEPLTLDEWLEVDEKRRMVINEYEKENGTISFDDWVGDFGDEIIRRSKERWK